MAHPRPLHGPEAWSPVSGFRRVLLRLARCVVSVAGSLLADLSARLEAVTAERDNVETEWLTAAAVLE